MFMDDFWRANPNNALSGSFDKEAVGYTSSESIAFTLRRSWSWFKYCWIKNWARGATVG